MDTLAERLSEVNYTLHSDVPNISEQWNTKIKFEANEICVNWDNAKTFGAELHGIQEHVFRIQKSDLVKIISMPKHDIPNEDNSMNIDHYPELIIKHKDPYGVVDNFTSTFRNGSSYWIKALAKIIHEKYNIQIEQPENKSE